MMAKVKLNPILEQIRGQMGDLVFKRYGDEVVISQKPDLSGHQMSEAQLAAQERFRRAALYGKVVFADPDTKALYTEAAKAKAQPVFSLAVADFFNAPSVDEVDLSGYSGAVGDEIVILASDDFDVMHVLVTITDSDSAVIESGGALEDPPSSDRWVYTTTTAVDPGQTLRIAVRAEDRPGGVGEAEEDVTL
jgi:hypothetical protein